MYGDKFYFGHGGHLLNFLSVLQGMGLVNHVFSEDSLKKLYVSNLGIGHTRYSTSGVSVLDNCQPFVVETLHGKIAVAHNGELTNAARLRRKVGISLSHFFFTMLANTVNKMLFYSTMLLH